MVASPTAAARTAAPFETLPALPVRRFLLADDLPLHRAERPEQLVLLLGRDLELVEGLDEILHQRRELRVRDAHAGVRRLHVLAGVLARPAAGLADLIHEHALQPRDVRAREPLVDPRVDRKS